MKRILRIGMDVHSTNYTLCAIEPRFDGDDIIYANIKVTPEPDNIVQFIENIKKKGSIKILKLSDGSNELLNIPDGTPLAGAKFDVRNSKGELIGVFETNSEGIILIENLPYGEYVVAEIEAPAGYVITHEPMITSIVDDGQIVEVVMKNSPVLPKTGNDFNVVPMIIVTILFVSFIGVLVLKNKNEREEIKYE